MVQPDISVIITAYNVASYIVRAVNSALQQQGITLEVIVVDDASSDATLEVLSGIHDPRVTIIRVEQNSGPAAARNRAIDIARGRWLAVLDGDDSFAPGRLAELYQCATAAKADIVVDNLTIVNESDGSESVMFAKAYLASMPSMTAEHFIAGNQCFTSGYGLGYLKPMFRTDFLKERRLRYRESIRIGEDYVLLLEALAFGARCHVHPVAGYRYTVRVGSISHRLTTADVERIQTEDARIFATHHFSQQAIALQSSRMRHLRVAYHYNILVAAIKQRNWRDIAMVLRTDPLAARHLWLPVRKRLVRLIIRR